MCVWWYVCVRCVCVCVYVCARVCVCVVSVVYSLSGDMREASINAFVVKDEKDRREGRREMRKRNDICVKEGEKEGCVNNTMRGSYAAQ